MTSQIATILDRAAPDESRTGALRSTGKACSSRMPGIFITFEGPEGAGKSTQVRLLAERLRSEGHEVVVTREPGGTPTGERIRAILLDPGSEQLARETEALLHSAARAQHIADVIQPALKRGAIVISDRFKDSTLAYQGAGRGLDVRKLAAIQAFATRSIEPDLTILLDLPVEIGLARRLGEPGTTNRMDAESSAFHAKVRQAFLEMARAEPDRWIVVDARNDAAAVASEVVKKAAA